MNRKELVQSAVSKLTALRIKERGEIASKAVEKMLNNPYTKEQAKAQVKYLNNQTKNRNQSSTEKM